MVGQTFSVTATLTYEDSSAAANKTVKFIIWYDNNPSKIEEADTDEDGSSAIIVDAREGVSRIQVSAIFEGDRETNPNLLGTIYANTPAGTNYVIVTTVLGKIIGIFLWIIYV